MDSATCVRSAWETKAWRGDFRVVDAVSPHTQACNWFHGLALGLYNIQATVWLIGSLYINIKHTAKSS